MTDDEDSFNERPTPPLEREDGKRRGARSTFGAFDSVEVTDPISWLEGDLDAAARNLVERSSRAAGEATPWGQTAKLIQRCDDRHKQVVKALRGFRQAVSPDVLDKIESTARSVKMARRIVIGAVTLLAGSFVAVAASYRDHEQRVGADQVRLERAIQDIKDGGERLDRLDERCTRAIEQIRIEFGRRPTSLLTPPSSADHALVKGTVP